MVDLDKFLTRVSDYVTHSGEPEWQVGKKLFKDTRALPRLQEGWRGISLKRLDAADALLTKMEAKLLRPAKKKPSGNGSRAGR